MGSRECCGQLCVWVGRRYLRGLGGDSAGAQLQELGIHYTDYLVVPFFFLIFSE